MSDVEKIYGLEKLDTRTKYGQVYMATHKGGRKLPFMNRSFISFSFGGKDIEDFGLIATIENDRLDRLGSSEFEDLVDEYNIVDGLFYWGTHFKPNKMTFKLATDGITLRELEDFKSWFAGGKTRELILSEHPNRAILARAESPSSITLLPFEEPTTVMVSGKEYHTSTTKYKGEITLTFIMDMPFWYSKINIFGYYDAATETYKDMWYDPVSLREIDIFDAYNNLDVMKIVLEDNIPISSMITTSFLLGNNTYAHLNKWELGHIAEKLDSFIYLFLNHDEEHGSFLSLIKGEIDRTTESVYVYSGDAPSLYNIEGIASEELDTKEELPFFLAAINYGLELKESETRVSGSNTCAEIYAAAQTAFPDMTGFDEPNNPLYIYNEDNNIHTKIYNNDLNNTTIGGLLPGEGARIAGPHMAENTGVESLAAGSAVQFYYAGTAPAYPTLIFTLTPEFDSETNYIKTPCNSYASTLVTEDDKLIPYNTITIESLEKKEFRFTTPSIYTAYNEVVKIFSSLNTRVGESWEVIRTLIRDNVKHHAVRDWACRIIDLFGNTVISGANISDALTNFRLKSIFLDNNDLVLSSTYEINSETGKAIGKFSYRKYDTTGSGTPPYTIITDVEEDVGDMIRSKYLIITDRNHPTEQGRIIDRTPDNDYTKTYSHSFTHNVSNGLKNVYIKYKNMYL